MAWRESGRATSDSVYSNPWRSRLRHAVHAATTSPQFSARFLSGTRITPSPVHHKQPRLSGREAKEIRTAPAASKLCPPPLP